MRPKTAQLPALRFVTPGDAGTADRRSLRRRSGENGEKLDTKNGGDSDFPPPGCRRGNGRGPAAPGFEAYLKPRRLRRDASSRAERTASTRSFFLKGFS